MRRIVYNGQTIYETKGRAAVDWLAVYESLTGKPADRQEYRSTGHIGECDGVTEFIQKYGLDVRCMDSVFTA